MERKPFKILLVEDDRTQASLFCLAMREIEPANKVNLVYDGEEATNVLLAQSQCSHRGAFAGTEMLITDLNMPHMDGLHLLAWLKDHPECSIFPTIMMTNSGTRADIDEAYRLGVNSYITKPSGFNDLRRVLQTVLDYWAIAERPNRRERPAETREEG